MSEEKPPEQIATKQIPRVDPVMEMLKQLSEKTESGFRNVRADVQLVANDVSLVKDQVRVVEGRVGVLEEARSRTSSRVREVSEHDLEQEAKIADVIVWRKSVDEHLSAQDDKLETIHTVATEIKNAITHPLGKQALKSLAVLLIAAATAAAGYTAGHEPTPKTEQAK